VTTIRKVEAASFGYGIISLSVLKILRANVMPRQSGKKAARQPVGRSVRLADRKAPERDVRARPIVERMADIHERMRRVPRTGKKAGKAFFDREWGDDA
jgi:hypothetical protein